MDARSATGVIGGLATVLIGGAMDWTSAGVDADVETGTTKDELFGVVETCDAVVDVVVEYLDEVVAELLVEVGVHVLPFGVCEVGAEDREVVAPVGPDDVE